MSTTALTLSTAPRDLEAIAKIGRFNMRVLAQEGGLFANEETKTAFMQMPNDKQAEEILRMLQRHDKKAGKPAGAAAAAGTRTPVNSTTKAGSKKAAETPADETPAVRTPANAAAAAPSGEGAAKLLKAVQALEANYVGLVGVLENLSQQSMMQQSSINRGNSITVLGVAVLLQIAEELMHAPQHQILQAAFDDMPRLTSELAKYLPDEPADAVEEEEEETDEGNG